MCMKYTSHTVIDEPEVCYVIRYTRRYRNNRWVYRYNFEFSIDKKENSYHVTMKRI